MKNNINTTLLLLAVALVLFSCGGRGGSGGAPAVDAKAITDFSITNPAASGSIDEAAKTISVTVPNGTDVTALIATFATTGASVKVGTTVQVSGTTPNDFSSPVLYTVTAANGTTAEYTVTVIVASSSAKAITTFSFASPAATGIIDESARTISVTVPYGTNVTALIATFTTTGASVKVGSTLQVSGTTPNNFTSPVAYTVTAADSTTAEYTVTVIVASSSAKAITTFSFASPAATGVIDEAARTISVTVPYGTDVTGLIASFVTTGASVKVGSIVQVSGTTPNNFTSPLAYTVTAADSTTADYAVTVLVASSSAKAITSFSFTNPAATGVIDEAARTISVTVPASANIKALIATFSTSGASVKVGSTLQVSGTTPNNFTSPLAYTVTAADSTTVDYTVTVTVSPVNVTHLAGPLVGSGYADGAAAAANFYWPYGITRDGTNLYVADTYNHTIRKIVIASGLVSTLSGTAGSAGFADGTGATARFNLPVGITSDGAGNLYVADSGNHTIRKIVIASGAVTTLAGTAGSAGSTDDTGATARFYLPFSITSDGTNLYVADAGNHTIRKIVIASGAVDTLAGTAGIAGSTDGPGIVAASFKFPQGIRRDGTNLYVADTGNHTIRRIVIASGAVDTLAGTAGIAGSTDATGGPAARFYKPSGITSDGTYLYVSDTGNHTIRRIVISSGAVDTLAGTAGISGSTDATGAAARFNYPSGITIAGTDLYVAATNNNAIRKIETASAAVTTFAGPAGISGTTDGTGPAARFFYPSGITSDGTDLYVADTYNHTIRKVVIATGEVTTFSGTTGTFGSANGTGIAASFKYPQDITSDGTNLYVADTGNHTIRKIVIASGEVTTFAGTAGSIGATDGLSSAATFSYPAGIASDGAGNLYVADTGNHTIRKIASGTVTTFAGTAGTPGYLDGAAATARFNNPQGITSQGTNLYIADTGNHAIRKIAPGVVTTLAGTAGSAGSTNGTGLAARFSNPIGITSDSTNLYVADTYNNTVRKVVIASGDASTLAGSAATGGSADGTGVAARFLNPYGIMSVGTSLYVSDTYNYSIRKISF